MKRDRNSSFSLRAGISSPFFLKLKIMIDVHCHLEYIKNPEKIILEAKEKGMKGIISSVADPKEAEKILNLREKYLDFLFVSLGFHPEYVTKYKEKEIEKYIDFVEKNREKIVAIGEIGLDYFWTKDEKEREDSKILFKRFLDLAKKLNLPVVIHCREAYQDVLSILKEKDIQKVCLHCFSGSEGNLKEALSRGYFISFATNICYTKKHPRLAKIVPLEKMLLETDSPWLDPDSPKTLTNRPWKIEKSAKVISEVKQISENEIIKITTKNAQEFFGLN